MSSFETFCPSYENISTRMNRLKHNSSSKSCSDLKTTSSSKTYRPYEMISDDSQTQNNCNSKRRQRNSPTALLTLNDQMLTSCSQKIAGKVIKNSGIKKYNQRQIKEIIHQNVTPKHDLEAKEKHQKISQRRVYPYVIDQVITHHIVDQAITDHRVNKVINDHVVDKAITDHTTSNKSLTKYENKVFKMPQNARVFVKKWIPGRIYSKKEIDLNS